MLIMLSAHTEVSMCLMTGAVGDYRIDFRHEMLSGEKKLKGVIPYGKVFVIMCNLVGLTLPEVGFGPISKYGKVVLSICLDF